MRALATACGLLLLPGCLIVGAYDDYSSRSGASTHSGDFAPDLYCSKHTRSFYLPFLRIDWDSRSHDLVVLTYDQTFLKTDTPFESFVLDSLEIQAKEDAPVVLVAPDDPLERRTHEIARGRALFDERGKLVFKDAIRRGSFTVTLSGRAIASDGREVPFSRTARYQYDGRHWRVSTIAEEWAGC
jgi:hypothetical protein